MPGRITQIMSTEIKSTNTDGSPALAGDAGSVAFREWCEKRGVWPRLTHEEIWRTAWNAAIDAADDKAWTKRDLWDEGNGYSPTKAAAAEEIGHAIRTLHTPNDPHEPRRNEGVD